MAKLTASQRKKLKASQFADPEDRSYPIPDKSHAQNALARVSQFGDSEDKSEVRGAVAKKFPAIHINVNVHAAKMAHKKMK